MADSFGAGSSQGSLNQSSSTQYARSRPSPVRQASTQRHNGGSTGGQSLFSSNDDLMRVGRVTPRGPSNLRPQDSIFSSHEQFATSRREFEFDEDEEPLEPAPTIALPDEYIPDEDVRDGDEALSEIGDDVVQRLLHANEDAFDYYTLLGLSRDPPPTVAQIRAAYHRLSLAFHPDKHPQYLKASAQKYFTRLQKAYETLVEPRKRVIYDLEGEEGVQNEYRTGGAMGQGGEAERQIGVKSMDTDEFRTWFMGVLLERERRSIGELIGSSGMCKVLLNSQALFSGSPKVRTFSSLQNDDTKILEIPVPLITAQALQLRQNFSVPLPGLSGLLRARLPSWKEIIRGELSINTKGGDKVARTGWEKTLGPNIPKLTFSTGITGALEETLAVRLPDDGHPDEAIPPPFHWYTLRSDKINISARIDHTFTDDRDHGVVSLNKSLTQSVDLDVTAGILPRKSLNIGLGRAFILAENTRPFYCQFRALFNHSLKSKPPVFDFRISRSLGKSHIGYCRWSSGDFEWPTAIFMSRVGPLNTVKVPLWLPQGLLLSNMRIGYFWIDEGSQMIQTDDDDDMQILDTNDRNGERPAISNVSFNNHSWHLAVDSSPHDARVSVTWGRGFFSRATEHPVRSRIRKSGEAIARSRDFNIPQSRGVRLEIEGSIGLDSSFGGIVRGVRRIGDFVSVGVGVGLNPERGLFISFSWSRLGQNIIIPVILLSGDELNSRAIIWALAIPWAAYVAVEFGALRPRLRRKRQELVEKTRKDLRENVLKRRIEAEQANSLMRPLVEHRQAIEREQGGLVILKAGYGVRTDSGTSWRPGEVADVTVALAALVADGGQLSLPRGLKKSQIIGFWDPAPLRRKLLAVDYLFDGKIHHVECSGSDALSLPMRVHEI